MKKCIEINLTKKTIEMIENIRGNLVEFAVALLRAGRGLKYDPRHCLLCSYWSLCFVQGVD